MNESLGQSPRLCSDDMEAADADTRDLLIGIMNLRHVVYHGGLGYFLFLIDSRLTLF